MIETGRLVVEKTSCTVRVVLEEIRGRFLDRAQAADESFTLTEANGQSVVGVLAERGWTRVTLTANCKTGTFDLGIRGTTVRRQTPFAERSADISRAIFRLGGYRGIGGLKPVPAGTDVPGPVAGARIRNVTIQPLTEMDRTRAVARAS